MIQIDVTDVLLKRLKNSGWKQNGGYAILGNPRVLERSGERIAVVKPIKVDPFKIIQDEIDKFFRSLINIIIKNSIKVVFLPGGGTIPIPQFFLDFCRENGINIHIITNENIYEFEKWQL
jgi:hypothetical protein